MWPMVAPITHLPDGTPEHVIVEWNMTLPNMRRDCAHAVRRTLVFPLRVA